MPHPLVTQLRFTRSEWVRGLKAVTADEATRQFGPINPIAWMRQAAGRVAAGRGLPLLVPPRRVAGRAPDAWPHEPARLRRRLRQEPVPPGGRGYSVLTTSAGQARASTRSCHSLILPSLSMTTPTRCAPFWGSAFAP